MRIQTMKIYKLIVLSTLAGTVGLLAASVARPVQETHSNDQRKVTPTLTVTGEAELKKPADQLELSLGVTTEAEEAEAALEQNNTRMEQVIKALEDAGLDDDEYETGRFSIQPRYSQPGRRGGVREIRGFRVTNQITIQTRQLSKAGEWIAAASEAGANDIDSVRFDISEQRKYRKEAIKQATQRARADAHSLAGAAGVSLKRIISISLDQTGYRPLTGTSARSRARGRSAPRIEPGDVTVSADVSIVYEIESTR